MQLTRTEAKAYIDAHPLEGLAPAKKTGYLCPDCDNGTKEKGDGLAFDQKSGKFKCFSCGFYGDRIDIEAEKAHISDHQSKEAFDAAYKAYGITIIPNNSRRQENAPDTSLVPPAKVSNKTEKDMRPFILHCQEAFTKDCSAAVYLESRGISYETAAAHGIGYASAFTLVDNRKIEALIIPSSDFSYVARDLALDVPKGERYQFRGSPSPFFFNFERDATVPVFIVEGAIDALSIEEAGGTAIGLGSTSFVHSFIEDIKKRLSEMKKICFAIALDNDNAGRTAAKSLSEELSKIGLENLIINPYGTQKDANEALLSNRVALEKIVKCKTFEEMARASDCAEWESTSSGCAGIKALREWMARSKESQPITTGFKNLDDLMEGGLDPGLYIIGGMSTVGKTTFVCQAVDQIVENVPDVNVLFFSLDMTETEILARSVSRRTYVECLSRKHNPGNAETTKGVLHGGRDHPYSKIEQELLDHAFSSLEEAQKGRVWIFSGHVYTVAEINKTLQQARQVSPDSRWLVIVDYLQLLGQSGSIQTDKQTVDFNVRDLKNICTLNAIPIIAISSINRESYRTNEVGMASYKESGGIEYNADYLFGMQPANMQGLSEDEARQLKQENRAKANAGESILVDVSLMKQRSSGQDFVRFSYWPKFNYFQPAVIEDMPKAKKKPKVL